MLPTKDHDGKLAAMRAALDALERAMDDVDGERMKRTLAASMDENSEEPIDPANLDPEHTEAENEGGHPGMLQAADVDPAETRHEEDEDKKKLRALAGKG